MNPLRRWLIKAILAFSGLVASRGARIVETPERERYDVDHGESARADREAFDAGAGGGAGFNARNELDGANGDGRDILPSGRLYGELHLELRAPTVGVPPSCADAQQRRATASSSPKGIQFTHGQRPTGEPQKSGANGSGDGGEISYDVDEVLTLAKDLIELAESAAERLLGTRLTLRYVLNGLGPVGRFLDIKSAYDDLFNPGVSKTEWVAKHVPPYSTARQYAEIVAKGLPPAVDLASEFASDLAPDLSGGFRAFAEGIDQQVQERQSIDDTFSGRF